MASSDGSSELHEELAQAVTSCRRILKAVVDHVYPPPSKEEHPDLDDVHYRNRLKQFVRERVVSDTSGEVINAFAEGLFDRFAAIDKMANKGVHAALAQEEAELCAIQTYVLAGEILRLKAGAAD